MTKPTQQNLFFAAALLAVASVHVAQAQGFGSSIFSDGGGLLLEPSDPIVRAPGTLTAPTTGGGGTTTVTGPDGRNAGGAGGALVTLGVSAGLSYEDQEGEPTEALSVLGLTAGVSSQTRNQSFDLDFAVDLEAGGEEDFDLVNPNLALGYTIENRNTFLGADLSWRETDVANTFLPLDFDQDDLDALNDDGTRTTYEAGLRLITGQAARFGTTTSLSVRQNELTNTVDPDLVDDTRYAAQTELRFSLDRRVELTTFASWARTEDEDAVSTTETELRYGAGLDVLLDRAWTGGLNVAITQDETETTTTRTQEDGFDITAETTRFLPNGEIRFAATYQDQDGNGRSSLEAERSLELANGAEITGAIGLTSFEGADIYPTVSLSYTREILRGQTLAVSLSQSAGFNDDNEAILRTFFSANYNRELTRNSRLGVTGTLAGVDQVAASGDTLAASIGFNYSHDLTEDWSLVARVDSRFSFTDGDQTDRVDRFSINLARTFSFRP